jgi:WD40 repeat protein
VRRFGLTDVVLSLAFSPDGKKLATANLDHNTITLLDVDAPDRPGRPLKGHTSGVQVVAFSPDGNFLASGSNDRTVRLWDLARTAELPPLPAHPGRVTSLAYAPGGQVLVTASQPGGDVRLWDLATRQVRATFKGRPHAVLCVAFDGDGTHLAAGCVDGAVKVWAAK